MRRSPIRRKAAILAALTTATCWQVNLGCIQAVLASLAATFF